MSEKARKYETIYILRADITDEAEKKINDKIVEVVARFQGKLDETRDLGKKPLAYRIAKHTKGHYFQLNYQGGGQVVEELERHLRLSEDVIRFLTVKEVQRRDIREEPRPGMHKEPHGKEMHPHQEVTT
ncbi:MAG TPA: 30S ribosomal protein S6 [bacterium]|nr:30S ribosomal protein S6 [bacterium]